MSQSSSGNTYRKIGASFLSVSSAGLVLRIIGAIATVAIARQFSVAQFGTLNFALTISALLASLSSLSIDDVVLREVSHNFEDRKRVIEAGVGIKALLVLLSWLGFGVYAVLNHQPLEVNLAAGFCCINMVSTCFAPVCAPLRAQLRLPWLNVCEVVSGIVSALVLVVLLVLKAPFLAIMFCFGVMGRPGATLGLPMVVYVLIKEWHWSRPGLGVFNVRQWKPVILAVLPLAANSIAFAIYSRIDQVLMLPLRGPEQLGNYGAAVRIVEFLNIIPVAVAAVMLPVVTSELRDNPKAVPQSYLFAVRHLTLVLMPFVLACLWMPDLPIRILYGTKYTHAAEPMLLLALSELFFFWGTIQFPLLVAARESRMVFIGGIATSSLNLGLNLLLLPRYGIMGAAWANLLCGAIPQLAFCFTRTQVGKYMRATLAVAAVPIGVAVLTAGLVSLAPLPRAAQLLIGCAGYAAVMLLAKQIDFSTIFKLLGLRRAAPVPSS